MSFLFHAPTPSYADEKLYSHLSSLSTIPANLPPSSSSLQSQNKRSPAKPSALLQTALHDLSAPKPASFERLIEILEQLSSSTSVQKNNEDGYGYNVEANELDGIMEIEVLGRAVTMVWKEVLQTFVEGAMEFEQERSWWDNALSSRRGVGVYLLQTMPHRIYSALPPRSNMSIPQFKAFKLPSRDALFKPLHSTTSAALTSITSPYVLTRREMLASRKELTHARDEAARRVGLLATQGPQWGSDEKREGGASISAVEDIYGETTRLYSTLCQALDVPPPRSPPPSTSKRSRSSIAPIAPPPTASPASLLVLLKSHLPQARTKMDQTLTVHRRPSALTRLWFPLLFLPPTAYVIVSAIARNKEWMREQVKNAKETVRGFFVQWVWEPLEGIGKTLRGGGEGLGVAPTTVKSDQASLERMVLDLGKDYYHLSGPALDALGEKVRNGDMEEVLRVYEKEMQSPVKNALMGSLIRTLLIQVQKTKTDLSLSLLSLDHLLRSQQLTFAFVGVAPSVLVLYGLQGWLQGVWKGEKRGKGRRREYFNGLRSIERLLITAPKGKEEMSDRDRGLLIVSVSGMRTWAAGLGGSSRDAFLGDLRMVEDPGLTRGDKLRVVERIWRCWGVEGKKTV
ncbi:hypothetical protein CI109_106097 [Kwoniella shandongensis]|uniref:Uncharacterized protein n=1 Tax=Kwoniella shandongensis TaxID=1734106 RepID=A0A5M6BQX4_9TREE|nr:uncharacterized protein CI109_006365 [Kwoniella shandongensis]KAA5525294.1 hypothetical protein CI109_006365 [Kwoniella shandongensis]